MLRLTPGPASSVRPSNPPVLVTFASDLFVPNADARSRLLAGSAIACRVTLRVPACASRGVTAAGRWFAPDLLRQGAFGLNAVGSRFYTRATTAGVEGDPRPARGRAAFATVDGMPREAPGEVEEVSSSGHPGDQPARRGRVWVFGIRLRGWLRLSCARVAGRSDGCSHIRALHEPGRMVRWRHACVRLPNGASVAKVRPGGVDGGRTVLRRSASRKCRSRIRLRPRILTDGRS